MILALLLACHAGPAPADPGRLARALGMGVLERAPVDPVEGEVLSQPGYTVRPVSLQVYPDFRVSAALWLPSGPPPHPAVLVAHGHFGEGKSSGESQGPAAAFAIHGWAALAVDTPGVEEGDLPGRRIHMAAGAHGRALLAAAGTSAMAVQLDGLRAGLDYLEARGDIGPVAVTGASGGSVQAFYLLFVDPRPVAAVLASFVPMPREARAGGCACDTVPGWPGPDPSLLAAAPRPTLWLSELDQPPPPGLPRSARFEVVPGPHGYGVAMVRLAVAWLDGFLAGGFGPVPDPLPHTPSSLLASGSVGSARFADLVEGLHPPPWRPSPRAGVPYQLGECRGAGPVVLAAGAKAADIDALVASGLAPCPVSVEEDEAGLSEALATRRAYADRFAGGLLAAARAHGACGIYAVRAWGVAALGSGLPYVLRDPLRDPHQVDEERDPAWVHAPGIWWNGDPYAGALATGDDPAALASALLSACSGSPPEAPRPLRPDRPGPQPPER